MSVESPTPHDAENEEIGAHWGIWVGFASLVLLGIGWAAQMPLVFLGGEAVLISVVIWQACDPFADAAQWVGKTFRLPGSVRGATLDAVASSMPELFSGIFFVIVAVEATGDNQLPGNAGAEGLGSTIATCAGSAVYNMILIPAFCAIFISIYRKSRPTIDVDDEVVTRDGMWFVAAELLLIVFLWQETMSWWMGVVFLGLYAGYVYHLYHHARRYRRHQDHLHRAFAHHGTEIEVDEMMETLSADGHRISRALVHRTREELIEAANNDEDEEAPDHAGVFFGKWNIPLNGGTALLIILVSTIVAAVACYFLVEATREAARLLDVPTFFVAVILAAAVSSVPDTFLSMGAAKRADDSGAVSNAFGSNIFDICICLSVPLLINSALEGWKPITLLGEDGKPMSGLVGLRLLLVTLTVITLGVLWHRRQLTRNKAIFLCVLYAIFIGYAVYGSLQERAGRGIKLPGLENNAAVQDVEANASPALQAAHEPQSCHPERKEGSQARTRFVVRDSRLRPLMPIGLSGKPGVS